MMRQAMCLRVALTKELLISIRVPAPIIWTSVGTLVNQFWLNMTVMAILSGISLANSSAVINSSFLSVCVDNAGDVVCFRSLVDR